MDYRIFIVEDHPAIRAIYGELIHEEPEMIVCGAVASGEEALEHLRTVETDLVLVDLSLPGMDGLELIQHIKAEHPHLPILIVSGHPAHQYKRRTQLDGARGYVDKAEVLETLIPTIRTVLDGESDTPIV